MIAAIDDPGRGGDLAQLRDEVNEIGNHFRRAAGEIDDGQSRVPLPGENAIHGLAGHEFLARRSGIHVAMYTGEIAALADIELEDARREAVQRETVRGEDFGKRLHVSRTRSRPGTTAKLRAGGRPACNVRGWQFQGSWAEGLDASFRHWFGGRAPRRYFFAAFSDQS